LPQVEAGSRTPSGDEALPPAAHLAVEGRGYG